MAKTRKIEGDGIDIHLQGGLVRRFTDKLPGMLIKLVGPAIGAAMTAVGLGAWQKMHDPTPPPPPAAAAYPLGTRGYEGSGRVSALESRQTLTEAQVVALTMDVKEIRKQTNETSLIVAKMDGKLDIISRDIKNGQ